MSIRKQKPTNTKFFCKRK